MLLFTSRRMRSLSSTFAALNERDGSSAAQSNLPAKAVVSFVVLSTFLIGSAVATADDPVIIKIEEDWRVEIGSPSPDDHAPQIVTVVSPVGNLDHEYSVFELNHMTYPDYHAGGMQLQRWWSEWLSSTRIWPHSTQKLTINDEVITFTSRMSLDDGDLLFQIRNGVSQTWPDFGTHGHLSTRHETTLPDLSDYSPDFSAANSRVAYAKHRVRKLVLVQVRYYSQAGLVTTDDTPRIVHEYSPE